METSVQIVLIIVASLGAGTGLGALWGVKQVEKDLEDKYSRYGEVSKGLYDAEHRIKRLETTVKGLEAAYDVLLKAAHGLKKDGQPRAKPGRKAK
jgi:hypothetical protein